MSAALALPNGEGPQPRTRAELIAAGRASFLGLPHPFKRRVRIEGAPPAGWSVARTLEEAGMSTVEEGARLLVIVNGEEVPAELYESTVLQAGDRMRAYAIPAEPFSLFVLFASLVGELLVATGIGAFVGGLAIVPGVGLSLLGTAIALTGGALLTAGVYYGLALAVNAIVGQPDQGTIDPVSTRQASPTALGIGNRIHQDAQVWDVFGECRFFLPLVAIPLQSFHGQKPSQRLLLQAGPGDCEVVQLRMGNTPLERLNPRVVVHTNVSTVDFPVVEQVRPGILLEDVFSPPVEYFAWALSNPADRIVLDLELPRGLQRGHSGSGGLSTRGHAFELYIEYSPVGAQTWTGLAAGATYTGGNGVTVRQLATNRVRIATESRTAAIESFDGLTGKALQKAKKKAKKAEKKAAKGKDIDVKHVGGTDKQTFVSIAKDVPRGTYEVRLRIGRAPDMDAHQYGDIRGGAGSDTSFLLTDVRWILLTGLRNEPAIKNLVGNGTFLDITLSGDAIGSDQSDRISGLVRKKRPILVGGARGATQVTSNPAACAVDVMTGALPGARKIPDSMMDFAAWQDYFDYCAVNVPGLDGTLEARHRVDGVQDIDGKSILDVAHDICSSARAQLDFVEGKYRPVIDRKVLATPIPFSDADVISVRSTFAWPDIPDAWRCVFLNAAKDSKRDERVIYNDTFAKATASEAGVGITVTRTGNRAILTRSGTWAAFPEEGWIGITLPALYSGQRFFLIYENTGGPALSVIDVDVTLPASHSSTGSFATTAAQVIERRSFPYTQRATEIHRNGRHLFAQKVRRAIHEIEVPWDWLLCIRGDLIEVSSDTIAVGKGRGRALGFAGTPTSVTQILVDEVFDLTGLANPGVRIRSRVGPSVVVTQRQVDVGATNTLRGSTGNPLWVVLQAPIDTTAGGINMKFGSEAGSLVTFGEIGAIALEAIVNKISKGQGLAGVLHAHDHASFIYDDVDVKPVPIHKSAITSRENLYENMPPPAPLIPLREVIVATHLCQINAGAVGGGSAQVFSRQDGGSYIEDGFLVGMRADPAGFGTPANNAPSLAVAAVAAGQLTLTNPTAGAGVETGNGDERVVAGRRSAIGTIHVDAASTGLAGITVDLSAPGNDVYLDGPPGQNLFANFRGAGFVQLGLGFRYENQGVFPVTGKPSNDRLQVTNAAAVAEPANGGQVALQTQFFGSGLGFDPAFFVGASVRPVGFQTAGLADAHFMVRALSSSVVFVDDPAIALRFENNSGGQQLRMVEARVTYELRYGKSGELEQYAIVRPTPGTLPGLPTDEYEAEFMPVDEGTGLPLQSEWTNLGRVSAASARFEVGPLEADQDFMIRLFAWHRRNALRSAMTAIAGSGLRGRPDAPGRVTVSANAKATVEGAVTVVRIAWLPADSNLISPAVVRYQVEGSEPVDTIIPPGQNFLDVYPAPFGVWDVEVRQVGEDGRLGEIEFATFDYSPLANFAQILPAPIQLVDESGTSVAEWRTADMRSRGAEPNLSIGAGFAEDPGDIVRADSELDPAVRGFEWEAFDPDTGTFLRRWPEQVSRTLLYTADAQWSDQQAVFDRALIGKIGLRYRMISRAGQPSAWQSRIFIHENEPGIPGGVLQDHVAGDPFEGQVANVVVFDGSGSDVDTWVTVISKVVEVNGQAGGVPSLVAYGGIFGALVEEGGNQFGFGGVPIAQPIKIEYRIVVNPATDNITVVQPGKVDITANGYFVSGYGGNYDLRTAGSYLYALQLRWVREGYNEGTAKTGVQLGSQRYIEGQGTRWTKFLRDGDEVQVQDLHPTNWYAVDQVVSDTLALLETNPGAGGGTFLAYRSRGDVTEMQEPNLRLLVKNAFITVREDALSGT